MNRIDEDIKNELNKHASRFGPKSILPAKVVAVNSDDTIKVVFSNDVEIDDCRLKAVVKGGNKVL